ncbi:nitrile hydratase accessory protein [Bosea sp. (in: a-proteobacteria)]|uniref:nitrile hydratase accessory protein n=1 Tax=Bosea sp. (in: a-proteobacteria) TaxID=1871050 RepID=UPI003B3B4BBC
MNPPETDLAAALAAGTPIPRDADGPVFAEPWQAQAFALVVALQNRGVFSAEEWAQALGAEIREALAAGGCRDGSDYYERWCEALEHLLIEKGLASHAGVDALAAAWARAAEATPHGTPIRLENDPLRLA